MISYLGDFKEDATVYIMFNTYTSNDPSASCTITNFINTDVHIHKDDGLTQRNNAAGITVSVDFDGITGSHMIKIDTSDNTVAGFWVVGHEYFVRIEGTTIDGATINSVIGQFSIENRFNEVDVVKISGDSTAANNAELAFDGTGFGFTGCTIPTVTTLTGHTVQTGDSFARLGAPAAASIAADLLAIDNFVDELETRLSAARAGYLDNLSVGAVALASGVDLTSIHGVALTETVNGYLAAAFVKLFDVATPLLVASEVMRGTDSALTDKAGFALSAIGADLILKNSTFALAIADAVADEEYTGATHNIVNSLGRRVREIGAYAINSGTAQAGDATCITLAATASAIDGTYNRNLLVLTDNTGVGQTRTIIDYDGSTKIAIIDREWRTNPDATTVYQIVADDTPLVVDQGVAQVGSTSSTIKLRAYASSINDTYLCNIVIIVAGTGRGQARLVGAYDGTSKVVTICGDNWITTPDDTSVYVLIPYGATCTSCVGDNALAQFNTEMDNVLDTAVPGSPTAGSINQRTKAIDELTEANGSGDLAAIKAKTDNLPSGIAKNVALPKFDIFMVLSSDHVTGATGKTVTGEIMKDGVAFIGITNAITEVSAGVYTIASGLTQAEMNADAITLKFTATDCDQRTMGILTS